MNGRRQVEREYRGQLFLLRGEKWKRLRLVYIGARDPELSWLPVELIARVVRLASPLPPPSAWALAQLEWFQDRAVKQRPPSRLGVEEYDPPRRRFVRDEAPFLTFVQGIYKKGVDIDYDPTRPPETRFIVYKWVEQPERHIMWYTYYPWDARGHPKAKGVSSLAWSEAQFLVAITFDPAWRQLFELCQVACN